MKKLEATRLVSSGASTRLECSVTGSPVISFQWLKDQVELSSSAKHRLAVSGSTASLELLGCTVEDSGEYVCVASSEAGRDRCSSTVTVKGWCTGHSVSAGRYRRYRPVSHPLSSSGTRRCRLWSPMASSCRWTNTQ